MVISEIFGPVLQGEGVRVGVPSIFLRLFGCNLRCPSFGVIPNELEVKNKEVESIIQQIRQFPQLYDSLEKLPTVKTGCDTYYAIYPEFKNFSKKMEVKKVYSLLLEKNNLFQNNKPKDLVITGGEPLLHQSSLCSLFKETSILEHFHHITFETNGTQILNAETKECFMQFPKVTWIFSISPKLSCSGHSYNKTLHTEAVKSYHISNSQLFLKFVVDWNEKCHQYQKEVMHFIKEYRFSDIEIEDVFIMPQGTTMSEQYRYNAEDCRTL